MKTIIYRKSVCDSKEKYLSFYLISLAFAVGILVSANTAVTELCVRISDFCVCNIPALVCGCVFLPVLIFAAGLSVIGGLFIFPLDFLCGIAVSAAISFTSTDGIALSAEFLLSAAAVFGFIFLNLLLSKYALDFSSRIAGGFLGDKQMRSGLFWYIAVGPISLILLVLLFVIY